MIKISEENNKVVIKDALELDSWSIKEKISEALSKKQFDLVLSIDSIIIKDKPEEKEDSEEEE